VRSLYQRLHTPNNEIFLFTRISPCGAMLWVLLAAGFQPHAPPPTSLSDGSCAASRRHAHLHMDAAWKPTRKPYVPSWTKGGSNIYREQQSEYSEYAKQQSAASGGDSEATRDSQPLVEATDPKSNDRSPQDALLVAWADVIEQACAPVHYLCVSDVTDGHALEGATDGRALRADGRELHVLAVAPLFQSLSRPARQQVVNAALADAFKSGALHSLQVRCWTPDEWIEKGSPADLGAPCSYSSCSGRDGDVEMGQSLRLHGCSTGPSTVRRHDASA
jgi:acid stress-induced BolA-like protein IbaG/YrbA